MENKKLTACPHCGNHFGGMSPMEKATSTRMCVKCCRIFQLSPIGIKLEKRRQRRRRKASLEKRKLYQRQEKNKRERL